MTYKSFFLLLLIRVVLLLGTVTLIAYGISLNDNYFLFSGILLTLIVLVNLYRFVTKRFVEMDDFFESVKYRDFSRWFTEEHGPKDIRNLHKGFNLVNRTFKAINKERQAQFLYLQKILEMVDVGIIAYNIENGDVLWVNDSLLKIIDLPSFKNIRFVKKRRGKMYDDLFETFYPHYQSINLEMRGEILKVLISDTIFQVEENSFKLIVIQNIENTLNKNESEAWKKLLSVMTHEIMNSIAPISSLSETLHEQIDTAITNPNKQKLNLEDLNTGIVSIKKRSEGLMKFAKTYRTLNKVSQVNKSRILVNELFKSINDLMQPTLNQKNIQLEFKNNNPKLELNIDTHLIEQVLINLIINAKDACDGQKDSKISLSTEKNRDNIVIKVTDNGKGIANEILETIFVPFFSTKKSGSGIGLSLSKQIMMLHNGRIQVQSEPEKGTIISLIF
ncbi:ATP-binding protein [Flaviramulus sp. BrNp1-15]|uniref:sensor histidine kinase n=1 Tax=Flaviramulus sp. BrNp1-15 TaxID=2916754 RepID=UPI001EE9A060|nr:ATP-binding protein [Flaviramulus sp. BrNp1-15]ULC59202.1 ATP-binding protein [Flaviramulus sp. BrNp1-15]